MEWTDMAIESRKEITITFKGPAGRAGDIEDLRQLISLGTSQLQEYKNDPENNSWDSKKLDRLIALAATIRKETE